MTKNSSLSDGKERNLMYETCVYIGKSIHVGKRVYDQFYSPHLSQIIKNAGKKGYDIEKVNPRRIEGLHNEERESDGEFKNKKIYISDIDIITFDDSNRGLAGRDVLEFLLIQETDEYPLLNKQFAYRETGIEGFEDEEEEI
ncbi:hypothetical protein ACSS6N_06750 [Peribacillus frigoritolerans]|uniref:hypothetical protein n=1 Tax=Peribacillus frigoritolerans TaxID=450367 RepID=UPI003F85AD11